MTALVPWHCPKCARPWRVVPTAFPFRCAQCGHVTKQFAPTLFQKGLNFAAAVAEHEASGRRLVDDATREWRLAQCEACPLFDAANRICTHPKCGCTMKKQRGWIDALGWASKSCPIGRWNNPPALPPLTVADLTLVVSSFLRFDCLKRLLVSARFCYPGLAIVVVDQSGPHAAGADYEFCRAFPNVTWLDEPFDSGISACRNRGVLEVKTAGVLILDDDHLFTAESRLENLLDVLSSDRALGLVCGVLRMDNGIGNNGRAAAGWFADLTLKDGVLDHQRPSRPWAKTTAGVWYRPIDRFINCFVCRKELLLNYPWFEAHKIAGEHLDHVLTLWHAGVKCAYTPNCIFGESHDNGPLYTKFRSRNTGPLAEKRWGVTKQTGLQMMEPIKGIADQQSAVPTARQPNILLLTAGHTGSSIVAGLFQTLGWQLAGDNDPNFNEPWGIRAANEALLYEQQPPAAADLLAALPEPWLLKDPRFADTLDAWLPALAPYQPLLLWLTRSDQAVRASWRKRTSADDPLTRLDTRLTACARHFATWPWAKQRIAFEELRQWVAEFDLTR